MHPVSARSSCHITIHNHKISQKRVLTKHPLAFFSHTNNSICLRIHKAFKYGDSVAERWLKENSYKASFTKHVPCKLVVGVFDKRGKIYTVFANAFAMYTRPLPDGSSLNQ